MCALAGAQLVAFSPVLQTLKLTGRVPEEFLVVLLAFVKLHYNLYRLSQLHRVLVIGVSAFGSPQHMILPEGGPCFNTLKILQEVHALHALRLDKIARLALDCLRDNARPTFETLEVGQVLYTLLRRSPESAVAWHFLKLLLGDKQAEIGAKVVFPEGPEFYTLVQEEMKPRLEISWRDYFMLNEGRSNYSDSGDEW